MVNHFFGKDGKKTASKETQRLKRVLTENIHKTIVYFCLKLLHSFRHTLVRSWTKKPLQTRAHINGGWTRHTHAHSFYVRWARHAPASPLTVGSDEAPHHPITGSLRSFAAGNVSLWFRPSLRPFLLISLRQLGRAFGVDKGRQCRAKRERIA